MTFGIDYDAECHKINPRLFLGVAALKVHGIPQLILYESHEHLAPFRHHGHHKSIAHLITTQAAIKD